MPDTTNHLAVGPLDGEIWGFEILSGAGVVNLILGTYEDVVTLIAQVAEATGRDVRGPIEIEDYLHSPETYRREILPTFEE